VTRKPPMATVGTREGTPGLGGARTIDVCRVGGRRARPRRLERGRGAAPTHDSRGAVRARKRLTSQRPEGFARQLEHSSHHEPATASAGFSTRTRRPPLERSASSRDFLTGTRTSCWAPAAWSRLRDGREERQPDLGGHKQPGWRQPRRAGERHIDGRRARRPASIKSQIAAFFTPRTSPPDRKASKWVSHLAGVHQLASRGTDVRFYNFRAYESFAQAGDRDTSSRSHKTRLRALLRRGRALCCGGPVHRGSSMGGDGR
jgi:hypothetical protein